MLKLKYAVIEDGVIPIGLKESEYNGLKSYAAIWYLSEDVFKHKVCYTKGSIAGVIYKDSKRNKRLISIGYIDCIPPFLNDIDNFMLMRERALKLKKIMG